MGKSGIDLTKVNPLRMLPSFPKAQKILDEQRNKRMFAAKAKIFPQHIHPPVQPIVEGKRTDFQREDRKIKPLKIKRHQVTTQIDTSDGKGLTLELFNQKASELGEGFCTIVSSLLSAPPKQSFCKAFGKQNAQPLKQNESLSELSAFNLCSSMARKL
jgi:hypothetical protein